MGRIVILDENTANQIAAGEVIERPASVVKELVENSLDAGATSVIVEIANGGKKSIRITDNGHGIEADDAAMVFERHATSKIRTIEDLGRVSTMGFRGEALASVASVAKVEMVTRAENDPNGTRIYIEGGNIISSSPAGAPVGTTFDIKELFYNTPARYKFLKNDSVEAGYINEILTRIALSRPDVSIKLISQGKTVMHTPGNHDLLSAIYSLYGNDIARAVIPVKMSDDGIEIEGFVGKPEISRGNRKFESFFVNGRFIYNRIITTAVEEAYKMKLMQKRFPFAMLKLKVSPEFVDVNVHPAKLEVRFSDEKKVFRVVYHSVSDALYSASLIREVRENDGYKRSIEQKAEIPQQIRLPEETADGERLKGTGINIRQPSLKWNVSSSTAEYRQKADEYVREDKIITQNERENIKAPALERVDEKIPEGSGTEQKTSGNDKKRLYNARIVGQVFLSYILLEEGEDILIIDQHAAHERICYEKIRKKYSERESFEQGMISPIAVNLSEQEMDRFNQLSGYLRRLGFDVEVFGSRTVLVRTVPYILSSGFSSRDLTDILEKLYVEVSDVSDMIPEETLYMMACKSAIKANRKMTDMEIRGLVDELAKTDGLYTCVHGRPVIISMGKKEFEKRFKRIV
ncbi:MAG: DNA mismatch repair endonuclease MutL [Bacillota bacterium]|jgi:DNA mismatch repair protein MutL|nr:DNA mismatch repair endonuclease MutL [Bacillota bacterium]NLV62480.1 DNA mismatch repair endonuclease MutL [Clostridiaceae bacterium]